MRRTRLRIGFMVVSAFGAALATAPTVGQGGSALDGLPGVDLPMRLSCQGLKLSKVLEAVAAAGPFKVTFEGGVGDRIVTVSWLEEQTMKQALIRLAQEYDLSYSLPARAHLAVGNRAAEGAVQEEDESVRRDAPGTAGSVPFILTEGMTPPRLVSRVRPEYPEQARKARLEGQVSMRVVIAEDGTIADVTTLRSTNLLFEDTALRSVKPWRYEPARLGSEPVAVYFTVVVEFRLE